VVHSDRTNRSYLNPIVQITTRASTNLSYTCSWFDQCPGEIFSSALEKQLQTVKTVQSTNICLISLFMECKRNGSVRNLSCLIDPLDRVCQNSDGKKNQKRNHLRMGLRRYLRRPSTDREVNPRGRGDVKKMISKILRSDPRKVRLRLVTPQVIFQRCLENSRRQVVSS
jgi:hypothetical protein